MKPDTRRGVALAARENKPHIHVACGVLRDGAGRVLIVQRPPGKIAAGKWEFPGGKIEAGETPAAALRRELEEEIGIRTRVARPLLHFVQSYLERVVTLETWLVTGWDGEVQACEGQALAWRAADDTADLDVLPTVGPILGALMLPEDYVFTPPDAALREILAGLDRLPAEALLRVRLPGLSDPAYDAVARELVGQAAPRGLRVVLDRDLEMVHRLGASGWHLSQPRLVSQAGLRRHDDRSARRVLWLASCHDAASIELARTVGMDAVVLGPVRSTNTHPGQAPLGWASFADLAGAARLPVYAIGGLGPSDKGEAFTHRAQGVAGISAYWSRSGF